MSKENLKAKSPKLLKHIIAAPIQCLPTRGPWFCTELATSPGGAWGRASPKENRWAGCPQCPYLEQPFCFPTKHPASVPLSSLTPWQPPLTSTPPFCLWAGSEEPMDSGGMGATLLYDWEMDGKVASNWCGATVAICLVGCHQGGSGPFTPHTTGLGPFI